MSEQSDQIEIYAKRTRTLALVTVVAGIAAVTAMAAQSCSPEAQQVAAPIAAVAPSACLLMAEGSAEREVCDASARLAAALQRLTAERAAQPSPAASSSLAPSTPTPEPESIPSVAPNASEN